MFTYVVRRLLYSIPVLFATSIIIFFSVTAAGDPLGQVRQIPRVSQVTIDNIIERNHLDRPVVVQYGYWLKSAFTDGFGRGLLSREPILPDIRRVMGNTLQIIIASEIIAVILAALIGVISAIRQYSIFDYTATTFSFLGFSLPVFFLAVLLKLVFVTQYNATGVRLFYTAGLSSPEATNFVIDRIQHLALPVISLSVLGVAQFSRYVRASMLEVVNSDYVRTARAKGLIERRVVMKHALRNAMIPFVTAVAIDFGALFGGTIVTETVYSIDGMGRYFINALGRRDVYPLMAWLMITAAIVVIFNLLADILYGYLDPRIRYD